MDRLNMQKCQVSGDKQEVPGAEALLLADTGSDEMALNMQPGKQFLDPQLHAAPKIFQGRFDLSLKESDASVMQEMALLCSIC